MAAAVQLLQGQAATSFAGTIPHAPIEPPNRSIEDTVSALGRLSSRFAAQQEAAHALLPQSSSQASRQCRRSALDQGEHALRRKTPGGTLEDGFDASFDALDPCAPRLKLLRTPQPICVASEHFDQVSASLHVRQIVAPRNERQQLEATTSHLTTPFASARSGSQQHARYYGEAMGPRPTSVAVGHLHSLPATNLPSMPYVPPHHVRNAFFAVVDTAPTNSSFFTAADSTSPFQLPCQTDYPRECSSMLLHNQAFPSAYGPPGLSIHMDDLLSKAAACFDRLVRSRKQWLNSVASRNKIVPPHMSIIPTLHYLHRLPPRKCSLAKCPSVLFQPERQVHPMDQLSNISHNVPHHFNGVPTDAIKHPEHFLVVNRVNSEPETLTETATYQSAPLQSVNMVPQLFDDCTQAATTVLAALQSECVRSGCVWPDGLLYAGCLAYMLSDWQSACHHFMRILKIDRCHSEALSNLAACCLALGRPRDAEYYWRCAINANPASYDAIEHLVALMCLEQRQVDAVQLIHDFEQQLKPAKNFSPLTAPLVEPCARSNKAHAHIRVEQDFERLRISNRESLRLQPSLNSNIGRLMALVHAKGNMLYAMRDYVAAAEAFQEVALAATNHNFKDIRSLTEHVIRSIQASRPILSCHADPTSCPVLATLMLTPDQALQTATFCFGSPARPPGLVHLRGRSSFKAAVSVLSNSLLSLAKILQDVASTGPSRVSAQLPSLDTPHVLALYYLSLSLQPSPSTANNVGILLANINQPALRTAIGSEATAVNMYPGVIPGSGVCLALSYYHYGLTLDPRHAHLYTNLGSLLKDIGQLSQSIQMYERAVALDPVFDIALANLANAVKDQGRIKEAIDYYKRAVRANPDFSEALCGLANALNSVCEWNGRGGASLEGFDRWHVDDSGMLIESLSFSAPISRGWISRVIEVVDRQLRDGHKWGRGLFQGEIAKWMEILRLHGPCGKTDVGALLRSWAGGHWEGANMTRFVERLTRIIGRQWYVDKYVRTMEGDTKTYLRPLLPAALPVPTAPTVLPFHTFTMPMSAQQIRRISQRNALRVSVLTLKQPWLPPTVFPPPQPPSPFLKVGYVSSDFNNHPLAHLMQSVFGMHDKQRVKAFCYATSQSDKSTYRLKIERDAPVFYDVSSWSTEKIIAQIVRDGIHILVNLNGYTRGARNEIFAARPAPVQISLMGFAGSLGAEWCDYLLADEIAVPEAALRPYRGNVSIEDLANDENYQARPPDTWVYSENIIFARDAFFCCDHRQTALARPKMLAAAVKPRESDWSQELYNRAQMRRELFPDLPAGSVIMANFNQLYKIDPTTFRTWLRILAAVPNGILWLLKFPEAGEQNLLRTASAWAGGSVASRIRFTSVAPKLVHIARGCVADIFLDTPECNAHTTAADCLWSGTPILTMPRYPWKMCSRMAAGILRGAVPKNEQGERALTCLIVNTEEQYESTAIELCRDLRYDKDKEHLDSGRATGRLIEFRRMIWENRQTCALFDTQRWTKDLEAAYEEAWKRWVAGTGGDIWLKDIVDD